MARLQPEDLLPSEEELRLMREAQSAEGTGQAIGSTIGGGLGALTMLAGVPPQVGMTIGSGLGGLAGGAIGGAAGQSAQERLAEIESARQEKIDAYRMREEALRRLLEQR